MTATVAGSARFVGRVRELAELRGWLTQARAGRGRMTLLRAEPGMGKTRLVEELAVAARELGVPVVWGRCSADSGAPPLWPLRRIVAQLPGVHEPLGAGEDFGLSTDGLAAARFAQFVWLADAVVNAADAAGLLVIAEDLHWADSATAAALGHLAAELRRSKALVVCTTRPLTESDSAASAALHERPDVEQRTLSGLDQGAIADYLSALEGGARIDERYADLVLRQTAGNSLYVTAVARTLAERVSLRSFDSGQSQAALAGRRELLDLIREPMGRVSTECRGLVEWASVAGEEFSIVELSSARSLPPDAVLALVDEAVEAGLLIRPADAPGTARFVHALVRDGVYGSLDRDARSRAHRALAVAIEASDGVSLVRVAAIANHLAHGAATPADHLRASAYARRAGQAALGDLAYAEAATQFGSALYSLAMAGLVSAPERTELLLDLAFAEYRSGAFGSSLEHCGQAADLAEKQQRWDLLARAALLVDGVSALGTGDSLLGLCHRALALLPESQRSIRAQLEARLAYAAADQGDMTRAETMSAAALALAEQTDDPAALIAAVRARHQALAGPGHALERIQLGVKAVQLAHRSDPLAALWGRLWQIDAAFELGDLLAVDRGLTELGRLAEELRFPLARWHFNRLRAARESMVGHFALAEEQARAALDLADELQDPSVVGLHYAFSLSLAYTRGEVVPIPETHGGPREFIQAAAHSQLPIAFASMALALVTAGDVEEAARLASRLTSEAGRWPLDGRWIIAVAILADVVADVDSAESAAVLYPMLAPFADLAVAGGSGTVACEGSVARHQGRLAATSGRLEVAERHFRDAITFEERMGARPFAAISRMYLAEVLQARGRAQDLATAATHARAALAAMRVLGMPGRAAHCQRILALVDSDLAAQTALTPREREIVALVAEGMSNRQVAEQLFVSERTVETHVSHVLAKLGANTRTDIATWALSSGLTSKER
ncbi:MAG: LuxR C-terminal-related transcriptional regulator [Actinomycetota bacterium]|nr:LuxR C-terminal-related transcriptional regulator [Actinomycetota bacterium]